MTDALATIWIRATPIWREIAETLAPRSGDAEGVLPPLMILLTIVTGILDAVAAHLAARREQTTDHP